MSDPPPSVRDMIIDCGSCVVAGDACGECVVSVLLGPPQPMCEDQAAAIEVLAEAGLVPPLRLVPREPTAPAPVTRRRRAG